MVIFVLKKNEQTQMQMSPYMALYDILIDKDNFWRQMNEKVDYTFIVKEIMDKYSENMGRPAQDPTRLFKYLLLKTAMKLSDEDLIKKTRVDMEMKYFLGYVPEETKFIDPSLLSKFRKLRLADEKLLDLMINKTVEIALEEGVIEVKNKLIVDSTHTNALFSSKSPREELADRCKALRKAVYAIDAKMKEKMPNKPAENGLYETTLGYCKKVIETVESEGGFENCTEVMDRMNYLKEGIKDCEEQFEFSKEQDAKTGHKTADTSFFGFKTHIAMTPERIVVAATVTSGEKHDGKELPSLVEKSEEAGIKVEAVIGDGAYSIKDNLEYCKENEIKIAAKLSEQITHGNRKKDKEFEYNKDAKMYVCPAGHMAIRKVKSGSLKDNRGYDNRVEQYFFDVEKCKKCPLREGCYKEGAKTKTYSVKIRADVHIDYMNYMETEEYKELSSERYKIEAKNAELKNVYDYGTAQGCGLLGMSIQASTSIFLSNMKRILKLKEQKSGK